LVRQAFAQMNDLYLKSDYKTISDKFKLCQPISDLASYQHLIRWLMNAFFILALGDYPYPTTQFGILPAWPVKHSCEILKNETAKGGDLLTGLKDLVGVFYNHSSTCYDIFTFSEVIKWKYKAFGQIKDKI
jgi:hypothetical protein